ncbi:MAG: ATP-binding domain-containing protein [Actinomycetota bacterium]|nr:ATP-binding domain-containing protein [Actinomycetota bacterium]
MHPELEAEQAYVDKAYFYLESARLRALDLTDMVEVGRGGTNQARFEKEAIWDSVAGRLEELDLGEAALVFGRIDQEEGLGSNRYYIGRIGVWNETQDPIVVDWRAPIAEAFYRATGPEPMGLERRRHFVSRRRQLLAIEDELFGDIERFRDGSNRLRGEGALIAALETERTGRLGDIVGTIQAEQDAIIRAPLAGVLSVQGGPGTGKTVVALHRAAYLLYTHRFPLEGQGVLVVGPNRLFLAYIEQVLPSLGEAGVEMASLADLIDRAWVDDRRDTEEISRLKGDLRMVRFISRAIRTRQRPLREDFRIGHGVQWLYLSAEKSAEIVSEARRRFRTHNAARRFVEAEFFQELALSGRESLDPKGLAERLRGDIQIREALEWMWPVLTPAQLLNDCFGSRALIRAADPKLTEREVEALYRPRSKIAEEVRWTASDASLLDEARAALGARPGRRDLEAIRTYGHIVVDEIQDLSPMDLRMLERRSLNGSMTVVGDIAQATGAWAHNDWDSILEHLPDRRPVNQYELTVGYRIPAPLMDIAAKVLVEVAPNLTPARSVRSDGDPPRFISAQLNDQQTGLIQVIKDELNAVGTGNLAVIVAASQIEEIEELLSINKIDFGRPTRAGLDSSVTVVPVGLVKGLEVDAAVVVEPRRIAEEQEQGLRALYVALTRATKRVAIIHSDSLPEVLRQF